MYMPVRVSPRNKFFCRGAAVHVTGLIGCFFLPNKFFTPPPWGYNEALSRLTFAPMEKKGFARSFLLLTVVFVVVSALLLLTRSIAAGWNIDTNVLIVGNIVLFVATAVSFYLYYRALHNNRVYAFMGMIYGGMFAKMFVCIIAAFIYIRAAGTGVNKPGLFGSMFLYLVYSFIEIGIVMKLSKEKKNA